MSLPPNMSPEEYFDACVTFFEEYQFLYNSPNTDVLINGTLDEINVENLENKNIYDANYDITKDEDEFLKTFFAKASRILVNYNEFEGSCEENVEVPLSMKKKHEITYLTKELIDVCGETGCDTIVDFGAGLGYLDQLINQKSSYKVLGIDRNETNHIGAKKRQKKYHTDSIDSVKYKLHTISEDSHTKIQEYLDDTFPDRSRICITGLHACADLTVTAMTLFLKMEYAKSMVLLPCCYHLMMSENGRFLNIPLSECLKKIVEEKNVGFLKVSFLRLAAHPPEINGSFHEMAFHLIARGVIQLYAHKHGCKLKRKKRKAIKKKNDSYLFFESYLSDVKNGFALIKTENEENTEQDFDYEELRTIWGQYLGNTSFQKATIFVKLQNHLQAIIENFILFDRLMYLRENGILDCRCKKIFNESVSPRCLALLVCK